MMGFVIQPAGQSNRISTKSITDSSGGINTREHPSKISDNQVEIADNYWVEGDGRLITRKGYSKKNEITGVLPATSVTGTYTSGETVTGTTSSATGVVVSYLSLTATTGTVFIKTISGTFQDAETITGGTSGATGTTGTVSIGITTSMLEKSRNDILAIGFHDGTDSYVGSYTISSDVIAIKKQFAADITPIEGAGYGEYFYSSNGAEKVGVFHASAQFLNYDAETTPFTTGQVLTGGTSSATGKMVATIDNGTAGTVLIQPLTGTFQDNETITDPLGGSATSDGVIYDWYTLVDAPKAKHLGLYSRMGRGTHLVTANNDSGSGEFVESRVIGSGEYTDPLTIPFLDWTESSPPDDGDTFTSVFNEGGEINSIVSHHNKIYVFADNATGVFHLERSDVATVGTSQIAITDSAEQDFGGFIGAVSTPFGVFYANENGVFLLSISSGNKQEVELSNILGSEGIEALTFQHKKHRRGFDFADCDIQWDGKDKVFVTLKRDAVPANNFLLVYDIKKGNWVNITGWGIKRMTRVTDDLEHNNLYGITSNGLEIWKLLLDVSFISL